MFRKSSLLSMLTALLTVVLVDQAWPKTYRCKDSSGYTVLTDSPAQLNDCELLSSENAPRPSVVTPPPRVPPPPRAPVTNQEVEDEDTDEGFSGEPDEKPATDDTETVTIPVKRYGGSLVVPVRLNNEKSVQLILDTGATMTVLSTNVAIELGLTSDSQSRVATVNTAGGPVQVNITKVESMGINAAQAKNVTVAIHDLPDAQPGIDGLLGMSFLNNFLVTLDTNEGQLHLSPRE